MKKHALASAVVFLLLGAAAYGALFVAPTEKTMGTIQRIFYLHVSSAWTGLTTFFICFLANLLYVWRREPRWDWLAVSAAEVGLVFTTVVLVTGPIWAHPVWGIWWTWDARLTSTFVLWLLYISYLLQRTLWNFRIHRRAPGFWLHPLVEDAASSAGGDGRLGFGLGTNHVVCASFFLGSDVELDGAARESAL